MFLLYFKQTTFNTSITINNISLVSITFVCAVGKFGGDTERPAIKYSFEHWKQLAQVNCSIYCTVRRSILLAGT